LTPIHTRARAIDAIADGVKRGLEASKFVRQLAEGNDAESRWQARRQAEQLATLAEARALLDDLERDAERREDDDTLRLLARLGVELACLARMIDHSGTTLRVVRDDKAGRTT